MSKVKAGMKAMDLLKGALAERQAKAQKIIADAGQKWVRRGELEQQRKEEYFEDLKREEEKWKADEEDRFAKLAEHISKRDAKEDPKAKEIPAHLLDDALLGDDDAEPPVPVVEVIERMRDMGQPITLFGETDMQRYKRMRLVEKEAHEGKKNPDVVMLESLHQSQQQQMLMDQGAGAADVADDDDDEDDDRAGGAAAAAGGGDDKSDSDAEEPQDGEELERRRMERQQERDEDKSDSDAEDPGEAMAADKSDSDSEDTQAQPEAAEMAAASAGADLQAAEAAQAAGGQPAGEEKEQVEVDVKLMDKCDYIRSWARKALKAWEKELAEKPEEDKKKATVRTELAQHRQVRRDVRPLQKRLRLYVMDEWLLGKIYHIVERASNREYRDAAEAYLDLSIGKAAWPVGIGCGGSMLMEDAIGLHDRFNRNNQVKDIAFALNDDVTRKFVQALKRLMNRAQRYWPPDDPSKA